MGRIQLKCGCQIVPPDVLARLAQDFSGRLRWYSGPDGGPATAVNRAVGLARGEIIGWQALDLRSLG